MGLRSLRFLQRRHPSLTPALRLSGILPLPPNKDTKKDKKRVPVFANVSVYLRRDKPGSPKRETDIEATLDLEVVAEGKGDNPWRVSGLKANVVKQNKYQEFWTELPA